jgi:hypothetical protein
MVDPPRDEIARHVKRAATSRQKRFGIQWKPGSPLLKPTWRNWKWYATEKQRDQALEDLKRHIRNILKETGHEHQFRKVERTPTAQWAEE